MIDFVRRVVDGYSNPRVKDLLWLLAVAARDHDELKWWSQHKSFAPSEALAKLIHAYETLIAHVAKEIEGHPRIKKCHKRIVRTLADFPRSWSVVPPAEPDARGLDIQIVIFNTFLDSLPDIKSLKTLIRNLKVMRRSVGE